MPTTETAPRPVLKPGTIYVAHDTFLCAECAGMTPLYTGHTIYGAPLHAIRGVDVIEWSSYKLGPLVCEGRHLRAVFSMRTGLRFEPLAPAAASSSEEAGQ